MANNSDSNNSWVNKDEIDISKIPRALRETPQWILWKYDDSGQKIPKSPKRNGRTGLINTDPTDSTNSVEFERAIDALRRSRNQSKQESADGIGFTFLEEDDFYGVDYDDCYSEEDGVTKQPIRDAISLCPTYHEVSVSGSGIHGIGIGEPDPSYRTRNDEIGIECYPYNQFFTVTGHHLAETPKGVHQTTTGVRTLQERYLKPDTTSGAFVSVDQVSGPSFDLSDEALEAVDPSETTYDEDAKEVVEKATETDPQFVRLWEGEWNSLYESHSEADFALACKLAYWTNGRIEAMDVIFRESDLMRPKWDRQCGSVTYGIYTLEKARRANSQRYEDIYDPP